MQTPECIFILVWIKEIFFTLEMASPISIITAYGSNFSVSMKSFIEWIYMLLFSLPVNGLSCRIV